MPDFGTKYVKLEPGGAGQIAGGGEIEQTKSVISLEEMLAKSFWSLMSGRSSHMFIIRVIAVLGPTHEASCGSIDRLCCGHAGSARRWLEGKAVVLQGLDKVTARVSRLEAPIGATIRFGNLEIVPRACTTPAGRTAWSTVYLDITEIRRVKRPSIFFTVGCLLPVRR